MEMMMVIICLLLAGVCLGVSALTALLLWRVTGAQRPQPPAEEAPQEQAAAEARRRYEQGFFNLMQYDGRPGREKERENG